MFGPYQTPKVWTIMFLFGCVERPQATVLRTSGVQVYFIVCGTWAQRCGSFSPQE